MNDTVNSDGYNNFSMITSDDMRFPLKLLFRPEHK